MKKRIFAIFIGASFLFSGCGEVKPTLKDAIKNSYKISKGDDKNKVTLVLKQEPTSVERIDSYEIWKYEGIETNEETEESKYMNLIIKFEDGKVVNIGTFSCKVPKQEED